MTPINDETKPSSTPVFTPTFSTRYLWRLFGELLWPCWLLTLAGMYFYYDIIFISGSLRVYPWFSALLSVILVTGAGLAVHRYALRHAYSFFKMTSGRPLHGDSEFISKLIGGALTAYPFRITAYGLLAPAFALILIREIIFAIATPADTTAVILGIVHALFIGMLLLGPLAVMVFLSAENRMITIAQELTNVFPSLYYVKEDESGFLSYRVKLILQISVPFVSVFTFIIWAALRPIDSHLQDVFYIKMILLLFAAIGLAGYISWLISHSMIRPLQYTQDYLKRFLNHRINGSAVKPYGFFLSDERGQLGNAVMLLMHHWSPEIENIRRHRMDIREKTEEILNATKYEAGVAYSQASALSQLSSTVEELVHSVNQISTDAVLAATMTQNGLKEIERGREHLDKTLQSIDHIHQEAIASSQRIMDLSLKMVQIEDVIRIINYVTDHTKILAFNAAIETATAGEMGERFGVVAKEIRQLAQNISDSTEEIKKIIGDVKKTSHVSVLAMEKELKQVNQAVRNANDAQLSFQEIHSAIRQVTDSVGNISIAIQQQRIAHEQVWSSIKDLDASAKELHRKSQKMVEVSGHLQRLSQEINSPGSF